MENNGQETRSQPVKETGAVEEPTFNVALRPAVFGYFADNLAGVYHRELADLRKDGSYQGLSDFFNSRFAKLMTRIMKQYPDPHHLPENPVLALSQNDLKLIKEKALPPQDHVKRKIHREMLSDIDAGFSNAKSGAGIRKAVSRVRTFFRRR